MIGTVSRVWRDIARADPSSIFGTKVNCLRFFDSNWECDRIPQPGYVGREYKSGGLLFVAKNPAAGSQQEDQYALIERLAAADDDEVELRLIELCDVLHRDMQTWHRIYNRYVEPTLCKCGLSFREVAYTNLLKWRANRPTSSLYRADWNAHTKRQIEALEPSLIVVLGLTTAADFNHLVASSELSYPVIALRRTNGDRGSLPPDTTAAILKVAETYQAN